MTPLSKLLIAIAAVWTLHEILVIYCIMNDPRYKVSRVIKRYAISILVFVSLAVLFNKCCE